MAVTKLGLNMSAINDAPAFNLSIDIDGTQIIRDLPTTADTLTNGLWVFGALFVIFIVIYWILADKSPFADFGYSDARGLAISAGICSVLGIMMVMIGWMTDLKAVGFFHALYMLLLIFIQFYENKE